MQPGRSEKERGARPRSHERAFSLSCVVRCPMPLHDSYDIYLEVDGARLQEYDVAFDGSTRPPTVSCWIPSQSGKVRASLLWS
jgi:hypothetical protein